MPILIVRSINPGTVGWSGVPSQVGHAWIEIVDSVSSPYGGESYGYYPEITSPSYFGEVRPVDPSDPNSYSDRENYLGIGDSKQFEITEEQAQAVRDYAKLADYGWYNLIPVNPLFDNNCATFAVGALKAAGIGVDMPLNGFIPWLLPVRTGLFCELNPEICDLFSRARTTASPLVFDLDGDGIEIAQLSGNSPVLFDHDANGVKTGSAWLKSDDALLVLDRDGNGTIDSGRELFGNNTVLAGGGKAADGYAALGELDSNGDGLIDVPDARFGELRLWRDLDQDRVSDDGELFGLEELGVSQISLAKTAGNQMLGDGTRLDGSAGFTVNGETRTYTDAWFAENAFFREFTDVVPLTAEAAALPGMKGAGAVCGWQGINHSFHLFENRGLFLGLISLFKGGYTYG